MSFRYNSVVIMGNNVQAWSTGRFPCTNVMSLGNDGNLQASCNGKRITWSMGLGKKGPVSTGAIKVKMTATPIKRATGLIRETRHAPPKMEVTKAFMKGKTRTYGGGATKMGFTMPKLG